MRNSNKYGRRKYFLKVFFLSTVYCLLTTVYPSQAHCFFFFGHSDKAKQSSEKSAPSAPALAEPLTLEEAYRLALKQSEDVASKGEELQRAQGHLYQALNEVMPSVSFNMTRFDQDVNADLRSSGTSDSSSGSGSSCDSSRFESFNK